MTIFEIGSKCVTARYSENDDGSVRVRNNGYYSLTGWSGGTAAAYLTDPEAAKGELFVSFNGQVPGPDTEPNYNILATDYDTYTVVYSCNDYTIFSNEYLWILARDPVASDAVFEVARGVIETVLPEYNIDSKMIFAEDNDTCPYDDQPL